MNRDPNRDTGGFRYTYSGRESAEIKKIRDKYRPATPDGQSPTDKMAHIRRLDARVNSRGTAVSLIVGVLSVLILGFGMSLVMTTDLPTALGLERVPAMFVGISTGLVGIIGVVVAYPLYHAVTERERRRVAPEIIRLTDELLQEADADIRPDAGDT